MKKICRNCRWYNRRYDGVAEESVCCHKGVHEEIKGEHIYNGEKLEYTKTNRLIEGNYIVAQIKPPWCPGFEKLPEEMPEEMADKIFGSDKDEAARKSKED